MVPEDLLSFYRLVGLLLFTTEQVPTVKELKRAQAFVKTSCLLLSCCMQYMDVAVIAV